MISFPRPPEPQAAGSNPAGVPSSTRRVMFLPRGRAQREDAPGAPLNHQHSEISNDRA